MIFFDSYAIIEIIKENPNYEKFKDETIITNTLNISEIFYCLMKEFDQETAEGVINKINCVFIEITEEIALESAVFRFKNKSRQLSYADCIGYVSAKKNNMKFLTGDKKFQKFENVEFV